MPKSRVLVIEDDEGVREALSLLLDIEGYIVSTASDGAEALDLLANTELPSLILCDLMMPRMDGWTFAGEIKKDPRLAAIPLVFVTAFAERASSLSRAHRIIRKPVDPRRLMEVVEQHCGPLR